MPSHLLSLSIFMLKLLLKSTWGVSAGKVIKGQNGSQHQAKSHLLLHANCIKRMGFNQVAIAIIFDFWLPCRCPLYECIRRGRQILKDYLKSNSYNRHKCSNCLRQLISVYVVLICKLQKHWANSICKRKWVNSYIFIFVMCTYNIQVNKYPCSWLRRIWCW